MSNLSNNHFIDDAPYDPNEDIKALDRPDLDAPSWLLIWRKFKRHKLGFYSGIFLFLAYLSLPFAGFIVPYTPNERNADHLYANPQSINLWHEGEFIGPYVYPITAVADLENFRWNYVEDRENPANGKLR